MRNETKLAIGAGVGIAAAAGLLWYFSGGTSASGAQAISPYNPQGNNPPAPQGGGGGTQSPGNASGTVQAGTPVQGSA